MPERCASRTPAGAKAVPCGRVHPLPSASPHASSFDRPRPGDGPVGRGRSFFGARRRGVVIDGVEEDIGLVGEVVEVDTSAVDDIIAAGRIPVVSTIAPDHDADGQVLNVNADTAAAALAVALGAGKLVVLTDVEGVYADWPDRDSLLSEVDLSGAREVLAGVDAGMIPKLEACIAAVEGGIPRAHVIDGRQPHSLLLEVFTSAGIGTMIVPDAAETSAAQGETS